MVDAVDYFLNNTVDLYIQAVEYCRISTSQIPTPVGAGIRQIRPESGRHRRILEIPCQIPAILAGAAGSSAIWPGYRRDSAVLAESPAGIRLFWPNLRPGSSQNGGISTSWPETGRDPAVFCRIPTKIAGIRQKWPDPSNFARICICQILIFFLILFYINIFYFVNKIYLF
jgi:hypothetical protein